MLQAIEEKKKQVKEDKDENVEFDVQELFKDAYAKVNHKRNLRKRFEGTKHRNASPSRQDRRRRGIEI